MDGSTTTRLERDTIYALASGGLPSAIAVLRLSGPGTDAILVRLLDGPLPQPRLASLRKLSDPETGDVIDEALVLRFAAGASYTGESAAELHLHGGEAVVLAAERALLALGARMARPGEFSRRALAEGRLDLAQAEAVAALIHAESETARRQALRVLDGAIGRLADEWRRRLIEASAYLETGVDFVDEALGDDLIDSAAAFLSALRDDLQQHVESAIAFDDSQETLSVVLVGPPNAGKSSLLNAILARDVAIVTDIAGTTRDVLRSTVKIGGAALELVDTAGRRESDDIVEAEGVRRAKAAAESAWRRIYVGSADTESAFRILLAEEPPREGDAIFWTKRDAADAAPEDLLAEHGARWSSVSARDGSAREAFLRYLEQQRPAPRALPSPIAGSARRTALLRQAVEALRSAEQHVRSGAIELGAADIRDAGEAIEALIGRIDHEQVLDAVFASFCIGK